MTEGAAYSKNDIPFCPTTATEAPLAIVTWEEAKSIIKKNNAMQELHIRLQVKKSTCSDSHRDDSASFKN